MKRGLFLRIIIPTWLHLIMQLLWYDVLCTRYVRCWYKNWCDRRRNFGFCVSFFWSVVLCITSHTYDDTYMHTLFCLLFIYIYVSIIVLALTRVSDNSKCVRFESCQLRSIVKRKTSLRFGGQILWNVLRIFISIDWVTFFCQSNPE